MTDKLTTAIDLFTLAGKDQVEGRARHHEVGWPEALGELARQDQDTSPKSLLYWHGWAMPQAIQVGDFKLYLDKVKEIPGTNNGPVLIDLSKDQGKKGLGFEYPEKVKELKKMAIQLLSEIEENSISLGEPVNPKKQNRRELFGLSEDRAWTHSFPRACFQTLNGEQCLGRDSILLTQASGC